MHTNFQVIDEFKADKNIRNRSKLNILKHMLLQKKATTSLFRNFILIIYFMYFRITLELGTAMLSTYEAFFANGFFVLILIACIDQGTRFLFSLLIKFWGIAKELFWIYQNIERIRQMK